MSDQLLVELALQCVQDSHKWWPEDPELMSSVVHHTLSMCGETGELANIVKKIQRGSLDWNDPEVQYNFAMELTDVFIYMLNLAGLTAINLRASYEVKRRINMERFTPCQTCGIQNMNHEDADHEFDWPEDVVEFLTADKHVKTDGFVPDATPDQEIGSFIPVKQER